MFACFAFCMLVLVQCSSCISVNTRIRQKNVASEYPSTHKRFMKDILVYKDANCSSFSHQLQLQDSNSNSYKFNDKIIIAGITYGINSESMAERFLREINKMGKLFSDYRVVIYDNDITNGGNILGKVKKYPKIYYVPQILHHSRLPQQSQTTCAREQALAFMRTQLVRFIKDVVVGGIPGNKSSPEPVSFDADWVVFMDMEEIMTKILTSKVFDPIAKAFKARMAEFTYDSFDVICANALFNWKEVFQSCYHDVYALIPCEPTFYPSKFRIVPDWGLNLNWKDRVSVKQFSNNGRLMAARMICPSNPNAPTIGKVNQSDNSLNNNNNIANSNSSKVVGKGFHYGLVRVKSCFGGLAFYKIQAIINSECEYDREINCDCEHLTLNTCLAMSGYNGIYVDKTMEYDRNKYLQLYSN